MSNNKKASDAYFTAYARAMDALRKIEAALRDMPAMKYYVVITWGHVGDMNRIADELEGILPKP
jgi:hypothetical protein